MPSIQLKKKNNKNLYDFLLQRLSRHFIEISETEKKPIETLTQQFNFTIGALIRMPNKQSALTNDETNKIAHEVKSLWSKNELFSRYLWNAVGMDSSY